MFNKLLIKRDNKISSSSSAADATSCMRDGSSFCEPILQSNKTHFIISYIHGTLIICGQQSEMRSWWS